MDGVTVRERAAARLEQEQGELARAITAALYAELPELEAKYGERGRVRCLEDMNFNLEHLRPAVQLGRPEMFVTYVQWLDGLLRSRGIDTREIVRSLVLTERVVRERFTRDEADSIAPSIAAALQILQPGARA